MRRALVLAALGLLAAGCVTGARGPDRGGLIRSMVASTVQLRAEREGGVRRAASGVVVATDRATRRAWIVTARHFVDPPQSQRVAVRQPGARETRQAEVVFVSRDLDLAVVEAAGLDVEPARLKMVASLGDEILVIAFPWGQRFTIVAGVVSQVVAPTGELLMSGPARMVDASVSYGSSGGGVFDGQSGELVGIVESYRTAKVAIPEMTERVLEVPVAGETTVVSAPGIHRFLVDSGLADFLPR